ncbi:hypothetical protein AAVH_10753 [Aphelenchoides avenae]|nr:hypothetical protein AAVH_10753 [Aphelenchus avenae]
MCVCLGPIQQCDGLFLDVCHSADGEQDIENCVQRCRSKRFASGTCIAMPAAAQLGEALCFCYGKLLPSVEPVWAPACPFLLLDVCVGANADESGALCVDRCQLGGYSDGQCVFRSITTGQGFFPVIRRVSICVCLPMFA